jgi:glucose uptake protein GlcU
MLTVIFGLASLLAALALGFVLGRVWEIRQDLRLKALTQAAGSVRTPVAPKPNNRFWGPFRT